MSLFLLFLLCWKIAINDLNNQIIDCPGILTTLLGAAKHPLSPTKQKAFIHIWTPYGFVEWHPCMYTILHTYVSPFAAAHGSQSSHYRFMLFLPCTSIYSPANCENKLTLSVFSFIVRCFCKAGKCPLGPRIWPSVQYVSGLPFRGTFS